MNTVRIPEVPQSISRQSERHAPGAASGRAKLKRTRTILCIDSYKPVLATLQSVLTKEGYTVFTASTVTQALSVCSEHHVDLAIVDCGMQSGDHICIAEQIRSVQHDIQMVVWFAGHRADKRSRSCAHVNFMKPVRAPEMLERLDSLLRQ